MSTADLHPNLRLDTEGSVARLTIDRPTKRNALTLEMWAALPHIVESLAADSSVAAIVVEGAGDEAFASGADIGELLTHCSGPATASTFMIAVQRAEQAIAGCPKPVIAMISGTCYGGGLELAMACDVRFAAAGSRFAAPPARLGVVYSLSSTRRLMELVGPGRARDLLFSGRELDSAEALAVGIVEYEVAREDLVADTLRYAHTLSRLSQVSVRAAKRMVRAVLDGTLVEDEHLHRMRVDAMLGDDVREGAAAFLQRRAPRFPSSPPLQVRPMKESDMDTILEGYGLLEGPVWDSARGLIFADVELGGVYALDPTSRTVTTLIEHRRGIGGVVLHGDGGLIVSGRNVAYKAAGRETSVLLPNDPDAGTVGFNDITTDAHGRVYAGSLGFYPTVPGEEPRPGALHVVDLDGTTRRVADGVQLSNGMAFSEDGSRLYHCDSGDRTVYVYDVAADGTVSDRRPFVAVPNGLPDGMAITVDGRVWVAVAHSGVVLVFAPDGSLDQRLTFPLPMTTSLCFGGDDLRDLFVVTGSDGAEGRAGSIYHLHCDVAGLPVAKAAVAIPSTVRSAR
jgi:gluconolactonase